MDTTHWILVGLVALVVLLAIVIPVVGFHKVSRKLETDEAIDAARFLALRDLREWLERNRAAGGQSKLS